MLAVKVPSRPAEHRRGLAHRKEMKIIIAITMTTIMIVKIIVIMIIMHACLHVVHECR